MVRAFVRLRQLLSSNAELARKLESLEKKYDAQFKVVFDAIRVAVGRSSVRSEISVEPHAKQFSSPIGAAYSAPDGAWDYFDFGFYKYAAPTALQGANPNGIDSLAPARSALAGRRLPRVELPEITASAPSRIASTPARAE